MALPSFAKWGNDLYTGKRSYDIVGHRRWWFGIAIGLVIICGIILYKPGLNLGIEFRGGSEFTVSDVAETDQQVAIDTLQPLAGNEPVRTSVVGSNSIRAQTERLSNDETTEAKNALAAAYGVSEDHVTASYVGPSWGSDITSKAAQALVIFLVLVAIVMAVYFRAWRMSLAALIALLHDLVVTAGIYAATGFEVTPATVIGFLTILGYSLYDTVVVFDKVRENTANIVDQTRFTYAEAANLAVNQTLVRSINTSVVALLPVGSILFIGTFLLGAGTLRDIALSLFVGMLVGAFSSVFIATPLEVTLRSREKRLIDHDRKVAERRAREGGDSASTVSAEDIGPMSHVGTHRGQQAQPKRTPRSRR